MALVSWLGLDTQSNLHGWLQYILRVELACTKSTITLSFQNQHNESLHSLFLYLLKKKKKKKAVLSWREKIRGWFFGIFFLQGWMKRAKQKEQQWVESKKWLRIDVLAFFHGPKNEHVNI